MEPIPLRAELTVEQQREAVRLLEAVLRLRTRTTAGQILVHEQRKEWDGLMLDVELFLRSLDGDVDSELTEKFRDALNLLSELYSLETVADVVARRAGGSFVRSRADSIGRRSY